MQDSRLQSTIMDILMKKWNDSHFNDRESIYLVGNINRFWIEIINLALRMY